MATAVSFDGTSIQTNQISISRIDHESIDHRQLNIQNLGNRDGGKLVEDVFAPRVIRLQGTIKSSDGTQATLESEIDDFKALINKKEKKLDVAYISGTRRYTASMSRFDVVREHFNITFANWTMEFVVSDPPFGTSLDTSTIEFAATNFTIGTFVSNATFSGSYRPFPIIQLTVNSEANLTQIAFKNTTTDQEIKVAPSGGYAAADILKIDTSEFTVTINGIAVDYDGVLPEFVQGGNDFQTSFIGDNWNVTLQLIYYSLFL